MSRAILGLLIVVVASNRDATCADDKVEPAAVKTAQEKTAKPDNVRKELLTGKVSFLGQALRKKGIKAYEEMDQQIVLVTETGELVPLVADWRGRAFYQDEKLRDRKVELVVRRRPKIPYAQVLMVYTFDEKNRRQYTDYWCDICSIPMYEIKECECCQGPIRLRFQDRSLPSYIQQELQREDTKKPASEKTAK